MPAETGGHALQQQATRRALFAVCLLAVAAVVPVASVASGPVVCPVRRLTDLPCPGCGLTRSTVRAVHGQLPQAVTAHPGGVVLVGLLAAWAVTGPSHAGTVLDPGRWLASTRRRAVVVGAVVLWLTWAGLRAWG